MIHPIFNSASKQNLSLIGDAAASASRQVSAANNEIQSVKADIEKLLMITEALWSLLKDQHGYSDEELAKRVEEIDMRDGKLDGKVSSPPTQCPSCNRPVSRKRPTCFYCGMEIKADLFER